MATINILGHALPRGPVIAGGLVAAAATGFILYKKHEAAKTAAATPAVSNAGYGYAYGYGSPYGYASYGLGIATYGYGEGVAGGGGSEEPLPIYSYGYGAGTTPVTTPPPTTTTPPPATGTTGQSPTTPAATVTVPNVVGDTANAAIAKVEAAGLTFKLSDVRNPKYTYHVNSQTPGAGSKVQKGSTVDLGIKTP